MMMMTGALGSSSSLRGGEGGMMLTTTTTGGSNKAGMLGKPERGGLSVCELMMMMMMRSMVMGGGWVCSAPARLRAREPAAPAPAAGGWGRVGGGGVRAVPKPVGRRRVRALPLLPLQQVRAAGARGVQGLRARGSQVGEQAEHTTRCEWEGEGEGEQAGSRPSVDPPRSG